MIIINLSIFLCIIEKLERKSITFSFVSQKMMLLHKKLNHVGSSSLTKLPGGLHGVVVLFELVENDTVDFILIQLFRNYVVWENSLLLVSARFDFRKELLSSLESQFQLILFSLVGLAGFQLFVHSMIDLPGDTLHKRGEHSDQNCMAKHKENDNQAKRSVAVGIVIYNFRPLRLD